MTPRKIYFDPAGAVHPGMRQLFNYPPEGYEFSVPSTFLDRNYEVVSGAMGLFWKLSGYFPLNQVPVRLVKAYLEKFARKPPEGTALTLAYNHVVFRQEPWVVQVEYPTMLAGFRIEALRRAKRVIERHLASPWCRGILVWSEVARKSMLMNLDCRKFEGKIEVVPQAVQRKEFIKSFTNGGVVKLLFVGSASQGAFDTKGGKEVIEAFLRLNKKYDNLALTVRSDVPDNVRQLCASTPNIKLIDKPVPWEQLEEEFKTADIYLFPTLFPGQDMSPLDAMSYELPVITTDYGGNPELVKDGITGFVVAGSGRIPNFDKKFIPAWATSLRKQCLRGLETTEETVVSGLVEKAGVLIENPELRRKMGAAGRLEIEAGAFSIQSRNSKLKQIFDRALATSSL